MFRTCAPGRTAIWPHWPALPRVGRVPGRALDARRLECFLDLKQTGANALPFRLQLRSRRPECARASAVHSTNWIAILSFSDARCCFSAAADSSCRMEIVDPPVHFARHGLNAVQAKRPPSGDALRESPPGPSTSEAACAASSRAWRRRASSSARLSSPLPVASGVSSCCANRSCCPVIKSCRSSFSRVTRCTSRS